MGNKQQKRVHRAIANASDLFVGLSDPARPIDAALGHAVRQRIGSDAIRYEDERWIVTELGFVTMAVLPRFGIQVEDALVVPGVDDQNNRGHLVLRHGAVPYHSLSGDPRRALRDAVGAAQRADRLVRHFGSREALRRAAQSAPWHLCSTIADARRAGLCAWGVNSWLARIGMGRIAHRTGLPRLFIRLAGGYGDRITAMTVMRMQLASQTSDIPTSLQAPVRVANSPEESPQNTEVQVEAISRQASSLTSRSALGG